MKRSTLDAITRRLPQRAAVLEQAFEACASFRSLCEDYVACAAALDRWRESASADAARRSAEYAGLLAELTKELDSRLKTLHT